MKQIGRVSLLWLLWGMIASWSGPVAAGEGDVPQSVVLPEFQVEDAPLFQALWLLARETREVTPAAPLFLLEGRHPVFQTTSRSRGTKTTIILIPNDFYQRHSFSGRNVALSEVLDGIFGEDPRFVWEYDAGNNVVNVVEKQLLGNASWPLSRKVPEVVIERGEGIGVLLRIAEENAIKYTGPGTHDLDWRDRGKAESRQTLPPGDFRAVVNRVLRNTAPQDVPFFLVTYPGGLGREDRDRVVPERDVMLYNRTENGFDWLLREEQKKD